MNDIKYNNCNLEMDQISSESFLNFVKDLDKKIAAQPNSNVEYKKNGYKLWKNFVRSRKLFVIQKMIIILFKLKPKMSKFVR